MRTKYYLTHPYEIYLRAIVKLNLHGVHFPDKFYVSKYYRFYVGENINWENPKKFNEKINWVKLYDQRPEYTMMVDKVEVKKYVSQMIGEQYIIPTIAVYDRVEDIKWDDLPDKFVIKCNHDSASYTICHDKKNLDIEATERKLRKALKTDFFQIAREWAYKNVKRKILVEKLLEDPSGDLKDYKFFCFSGEVKAMFIATGRQNPNEETKFDFFDENYNHLPMTSHHPNADPMPQKPVSFELMKELAAKLSQGIPHVRVDFYEVDGKPYFGEFTFYHDGGTAPLCPVEFEYKFGEWFKLPSKKTIAK